jgi:hypothetical protein
MNLLLKTIIEIYEDYKGHESFWETTMQGIFIGNCFRGTALEKFIK